MSAPGPSVVGWRGRNAPGKWGFLLAHHQAGELDRCWRLQLGRRRLWLCARCSGLYPTLLLVVTAQLLWPVPAGWLDAAWLSLPALPALVDWARHRLGATGGGNWRRCLTGAGLGLALGRTVYLNMISPWNRPVLLQLGALLAVVVAVEARRWSRERR